VAQAAFYTARRKGLTISEALVGAIQQANKAVYEEGQKRNGRMGSTIVAAVHDNNRLHVAHVGDARAYLARETALQRLTRDDTWVQKQVDAGLLTADEAAQHELRHVVTQALGNKPDVEVHLTSDIFLEPDDVFLLCSDGLYDSVSEEQLYRLLRESPSKETAATLVREAIRANATDNVTAVVVQIGRPQAIATTDPEATMAAVPPVNTYPHYPHAATTRQPSSPGRKVPLWLWITILSVVVLIGAVGLFVWLALRQNGDITPGSDTPLPNLTDLPALATAPALPTTLPTTQPATLPAVLPGATFSPTAEAALPVITVTLQSTATAASLACVEEGNQLFVWDDQQMSAGDCSQVVQREAFVLQPNQEVQILSEEIRSVTGPDAGCQTNEMIRIQSVDNPEVEGWVLANGLRRISPEESCGP
jgi:serine/threonine protein phosphatase PrpC